MLKLLSGLAAGLALGAFVSYAMATRNSSGTYSLPTGNPVVSGSTISTTWANTTLSDLATGITDSLDRNGKGAMLAPLQCTAGTVAAPGLTFSAEPGSGLYRIGAADFGFSVGGTKRQEWTATGSSVVGTFGVSGASTFTGAVTASSTLAVTGTSAFTGNVGIGGAAGADPLDIAVAGSASTTSHTILEGSLADGNSLTSYYGKATSAGNSGIMTYTKNATAANSTYCLGVFAGSASTLCVDGNDRTISHSLTVGSASQMTVDTSGNQITTGSVTSAGYVCSGTANCGSATTSGGGTTTATVRAGCRPICTNTTSASAVQCSVASTTLTISSGATQTVNYFCF
jgi:hypothetical protein